MTEHQKRRLAAVSAFRSAREATEAKSSTGGAALYSPMPKRTAAVIHPALLFLLTLLLYPCFGAFGQAKNADIVYTEGWVDVKYATGDRLEAMIGDSLQTGDSVITESDSRATLQTPGSVINVASGTVFTFQEQVIGGRKRSVFSTVLGSATMKFEKLLGQEPLIASAGMTAGIRGTELTVYAGSDGSTLVIVDSGQVDVQAQGKTVALRPNEGVEVQPGEPPGKKFTVLRGQLDFSTWNAGKRSEMLKDPVATVQRIENRMTEFRNDIKKLEPQYQQNKAKLSDERAKLNAMKKADQKDYYEKTVFPLEVQTSYMALNLRYYALSALSFRRYVLGGMYVDVMMKYLEMPDSPQLQGFLKVYRQILADYEADVVPLLVKADI